MFAPVLRAFFRSNSKDMFIIWSHYENDPDRTGFILYRNGEKIAEHKPGDEQKWGPFVRPSEFDHDHHTNLFRKISSHQLIYSEDGLQMHQTYEYYVEKIRYDKDGKAVNSLMSNSVKVKTE